MRAAAIPFESNKTDDFKRDKNARIYPDSFDNVRLALQKLGVVLTYNQLTREVHCDGTRFDDAAIDDLWIRIDDEYGFRPSKKGVLEPLMGKEARSNPVHPVREYLDGLKWDGEKRLDTWLSAYAGAKSDDYVDAVGSLVLIAAVRRVRRPGCKFDELLVLEGGQGTGKSSAIRALCPDEEWFSDDLPLGVDSKQVIERTTGRWIIEAAELHGNRGKETDALKAFLSRQSDGPVRLAYGRLPVTVDRQFVLIGTTNARLGYLKDSTGSRRFWPVAVGRFDLAAIARDRNQLWAEAAKREADGASIRLDTSLWSAAAEHQEERRADDPWEEILTPLLEGNRVVAVDAIWAALKLEANHLDNRHATRVAAIVQRYGFTRRDKAKVNGEWRRCWVKDEANAGL